MPAPETTAVTRGPTDAHPLTRTLLMTRLKWNVLALASAYLLPKFSPVAGLAYLAYGALSVVTAGALDSSLESLTHSGLLLVKVLLTINIVDALVRLQTKTAEEQARGVQKVPSAASAAKATSPSKLALGIRSSPQTRPSPSRYTSSSSPSTNRTEKSSTGSRAPIHLPPNLRATLDEANLLASSPNSAPGSPHSPDSSLLSTTRATGPLGASGRRWPSTMASGSPTASVLGASQSDAARRNVSPVQVFRARRAASGRARNSSGLQFDTSYDFDDDADVSTESHEVEYGLKVLNSSFSADTSPWRAPGTSMPVSSAPTRG